MGADDTIVGPDSGPRGPVGAIESPGDQVGPYTLVKLLGEGGFGTVWLAERRLPFVQSVALKIIKPGMDSKAVVARFEQERQALALMNHPHVAKVLDGGMTPAGRPYFAMEFVKGTPISEFCDDRKLPLRVRLELFLQVCDAIQHAHTKGIIHRDLKPANVLVSDSEGDGPAAKVIDFGIAKALTQTGEENVTEAGTMIGTPEYMSPEQAEGDANRIDTRTDVYSLGVILYELLTGTLPFDPKELRSKAYREMQRIIREDDPPTPSTRLTTIAVRDRERAERIEQARGLAMAALARDLKRELEWIPLKAMRKEPEERYQSAIALGEDVRNYLAGRALVAAPESAAYRIRKYVRRNRALVIGAAAVFAALVTGLSLATWQWRVAVREKLAAEEARRRVEAAAYIANVQMADSWRDARKTDRMQQRLADCVRTRRDWEWGWLTGNADASIAVMAGHDEEVVAASFLPGSRVITASLDGTARIWDGRTGRSTLALSGHTGPIVSLSVSDDGARAVTGSADATARVWDTAAGRELACLRGHSGPVLDVAASPDGTRAATGSEDGSAALWNAQTGERIATLEGHAQPVDTVAFSRDGALVATGSRDGIVRVFNAKSGEIFARLPGHTGPILSVEFSPDGTLLLSGGADGSVRSWDPVRGSAVATMTGHRGVVYAVRWSDDSARAISASADRTARIWDPRAGTQAAVLDGHLGEVISCALSPDGRRAATGSADGRVRLWDVASGGPIADLPGHQGIVFAVGFGQGGQRVVSASEDGTVRLWDVNSPAVVAIAAAPRDVVSAVSPSPDGGRVLAVSPDPTVRIHDAGTGAVLAELVGHGGPVLSGELSPDGTRAVTSSADGTARVWDVASARELARMQVDGQPVRMATFSPRGDLVATAHRDGTARLWSASTGEAVRELKGHSDRVNSVRFSRDGARAVTASQDRTARVWDCASGTQVSSVSREGQAMSSASLSPDGTAVLTTHPDATAVLWDAQSGSQILAFPGHAQPLMAAVLSPDGSRLVTASRDGTARIWDARSGEVIAVLDGHGGIVSSAAIHPDGRRVATACFDSIVRVWDMESGAKLVELPGHAESLVSISFSPDGTRLITGAADGEVRIWDGVPPRIRYAERTRGPDRAAAQLARASLVEPRAPGSATWLSDPTLDEGRPDLAWSSEGTGLAGPAVSRLIRRALELKQFSEAIACARTWGIEGVDPAVLNSLAWAGCTKLPAGAPGRDLDYLLLCTQRAVEATGRANPAFLDTLARAHWERGEREQAVTTAREALAAVSAQPVPKDASAKATQDALRASIQAALDSYLPPPPSAQPATPAGAR